LSGVRLLDVQANFDCYALGPLRRTLVKIHEAQGRLPPVLFLQMDNCWRENKNRTMFGYLCWLVETAVLQRVNAGFLIVGCVSRKTWFVGVWSPSRVLVLDSYTGRGA
jgi:hypothetical protein